MASEWASWASCARQSRDKLERFLSKAGQRCENLRFFLVKSVQFRIIEAYQELTHVDKFGEKLVASFFGRGSALIFFLCIHCGGVRNHGEAGVVSRREAGRQVRSGLDTNGFASWIFGFFMSEKIMKNHIP